MIPARPVMTSALLVCLGLCATQICSAEDDPKSVAVAFAKAIKAGDKNAAHGLCAGTADQLKTVDSMADALTTFAKFKATCDSKFGAKNILSQQIPSGGPDPVNETEKTEFTVAGETASAVDNHLPGKRMVTKLKKVGGQWKVDLSSVTEDDALTIATLAPLYKVIGELTDGINKGEYKTAEDALNGFLSKLQALQK